MEGPFSVVGHKVIPVHGVGKVTGELKFAPDIVLPNMLWMKILRSPHAHAMISDIDTSQAENIPGVVAILTYKDVPRTLFGPFEYELYPLDREVRFVGDSVAAIAAEDWHIAEEAVRAMRVQYEVKPAVYDPEAAARPGAPIAVLNLPEAFTGKPWWEEHGTPTYLDNTTNVYSATKGKPSLVYQRGDAEKGLAESDFTVERRFRQPMQSGVAHEPRACVALYENGRCTLWCSVQEPYKLGNSVARVLDLPEESVRIISTAIGGGFGVKVAGRYAVLCALLARQTGRPVKIWFTREEETIDSHNRPGLIHYVKAGAKKDGALSAFQIRTYLESGHWLGKSASRLAEGMIHHIMDLYHPCPNVMWEVFVARTNHPAGGPVRGRSDMESHFAVDCAVDELAHSIGMDPLEFRLKNRIREGDPMCASPGKVVSSVGVEEAVRQGAEKIGWNRRRKKPGSDTGLKKRGIGMAMVIHSAGGQPFRTAAGRVEVHEDGRILYFCGTADQGAEQQTTLRQMVAEILGVSMEKIGGTNADTAICPRDTGPISSRTVYSTGKAACRAAEAVKKKLLDLASRSLEVSVEDLELRDGSVQVQGVPSRSLSFGQIARLNGTPIEELGQFNGKDEPTIPWGFAATFVEVEVNLETGEVTVLRLVSSHDVGRAIHPGIVKGQIEGGASWGLGHALTEGFYFDDRTGTTLNQWFLDLKTPSTLDTPEIESIMVEKEEPSHPFGAKGCSEISIIGVAPAIANAIYNATGVRVSEIPLTPDRVLEALRAHGAMA